MLLVMLVPVAPVGNVQIYDVAPVIAGTVYITEDCPLQKVVFPVIVPAFIGIEFTVIGKVEAVPSAQAFLPNTLIFPEIAEEPKSTEMLLVLLLPLAPVGNVQT